MPIDHPLVQPSVPANVIRYGVFKDPFGVTWTVSDSTVPIEDVPKYLESTIIPALTVRDAAKYLTFLSDVFGAKATVPPGMTPSGKVCTHGQHFFGGEGRYVVVRKLCCPREDARLFVRNCGRILGAIDLLAKLLWRDIRWRSSEN